MFQIYMLLRVQVIIGLGKGLAPVNGQAITWTNDDPIHRRIHASQGLNVLR